jgi:hypothetical protein
MIHYANAGGDSGILEYELGPDWVEVMFKGGAVYRYSYRSAGKPHIEKLKKFLLSGIGANSYIMRRMKKLYEPRSPF